MYKTEEIIGVNLELKMYPIYSMFWLHSASKKQIVNLVLKLIGVLT